MQVTISFIDIAVIVVSTGLIIWWALKKGKSGDSKSYFLAGRSMSWIVACLFLPPVFPVQHLSGRPEMLILQG